MTPVTGGHRAASSDDDSTSTTSSSSTENETQDPSKPPSASNPVKKQVGDPDEETPETAPEDDPGNPASGDDYDPYVDPKVPSSFIADVIAVELNADDGEVEGSPTRDAVHEDDDKDDDDSEDSDKGDDSK